MSSSVWLVGRSVGRLVGPSVIISSKDVKFHDNVPNGALVTLKNLTRNSGLKIDTSVFLRIEA